MAWYLHAGQAYTGDRISPTDSDIPDQPSPAHRWIAGEWQLPSPLPDWRGLFNALRATPVYGRLYSAANDAEANTIAATRKALTANNSFTLLQDTMQTMALRAEAGLVTAATNAAALADLEFAIAQLRSTMATTEAGDLSAEELAWINTQLSSNGFGLQLRLS